MITLTQLTGLNIELGAILDHHLFSTFTGVEPSIRSNVKWIRTRHDTGTGTVDKAYLDSNITT